MGYYPGFRRWFSLAAGCFILLSCTYISTKVKPVDPSTQNLGITAPTKAHLLDGSLAVFPDGFKITPDSLFGSGIRYNLDRSHSWEISCLGRDSVVFLEYYEKYLQAAPLAGSLLAPAVLAGLVASNKEIAKALFGSCPTIYSCYGDTNSVQAECFSYSIAPMFECYDLDRLEECQPSQGKVSLKIRNEALETHYINEMKLEVVDHPESCEAFPTPDGQIVVLDPCPPWDRMVDREGGDISHLIGARDNFSYHSDTNQVRELTRHIGKDWIEAEAALPPGAREVFLTFRVRNTLLNTVLLYDVLLGSQGAGALNWIASMDNPLKAWKMDRWYKSNFGLGIEVWDGRKFVEKAHLGDCGPIAWKQVAVEVPLPKGSLARFRFTFLPDNWMVDWIGVSFQSRSDFSRQELSPCEVIDLHGRGGSTGCDQLAKKDKKYLITYPGDAWQLNFPTGDTPEGSHRTCFLKSRGYYIEWIRPAWLANTAAKKRITPNDEITRQAAKLWLEKKSTLEQEFFNSRISWQGGTKP